MRSMTAFILVGAAMMTRGAAANESSPPRYFNMPMFYIWYTADRANHKTGWNGGVLETPLAGYYDSRDYETAYNELKTLAEWGCNVACLSWWGSHQDEIVDTYARAARALRAEGYNVWLTCYVEDRFSYEDLLSNAGAGTMLRHAVERYVARYPDVFAKVDGEPFLVIYGRCGLPHHPTDREGFREYLRRQYETIERLNEVWKTAYGDFGDVEHAPNAPAGWLRAESLRYSVDLLGRQYDAMNRAFRAKGLPSVRLCADIGGFEPMHSGFGAVTRIFGGVHTYNDMALPEERDRTCFAYAQAAKHFGGLFFAHVKARYNDSVHRVPGFIYGAEPVKFDRWFTWALLQHADKVQHPSWNEFWEGSNIEPSLEYGKKWVEKNEFYSSMMDECWEDMRRRDTDAPLAVIFNEWAPFYMGKPADDLWGIVQSLRSLDQEFVLLPERLAAAERLEKFQVIIAPSCGAGFGYNERGERIADALLQWTRSGKGKRLLLSYAPDMAERLGVTIIRPARVETPLRWVLDVGGPADGEGVWGGWRGRETWGSGAERRTVRWTNSKWSNALLPTVPGHDYTLKMTAEWHYPCKGRIYINDQQVGTFEGDSGVKRMEFRVPKEVIGQATQSHLDIEHDALWVPAEVGQGGDTSTLGIAVDVIEIAAAGHENDPVQDAPAEEEVVFERPLPGVPKDGRLRVPGGPCKDVIQAPEGSVLARYGDGTPRFVRLTVGENQVIYDNGLTGTAVNREMMAAILGSWAGMDVWEGRAPEGVLMTRLRSGDTTILVVGNASGRESRFEVPLAGEDGKPLASLVRLTRDGQPAKSLWEGGAAPATLRDQIKWCGVYEIVRSPVALRLPKIRIRAGQDIGVKATLTNLTGKSQSGTVSLVGSPSLECEPAAFALKAREKKEVTLAIRAKDSLDWGRRTIRVRVKYRGSRATFWHSIEVAAPPFGAPPAGGSPQGGPEGPREREPDYTAHEIPASVLESLRGAAGSLRASSQGLRTGRGTVTVESSKFRIVFDESVGGAARSFVIKRADGVEADYGAGSFASEYRVGDRVVSQSSATGRLSLVRHGDSEVRVESAWADKQVEFRHVWRVYADAPYLRLTVSARRKAADARMVVAVVNTRLKRNDIRRIYPGFTTLGENTGWQPDTRQMHFGWKEYWGEYVPDAWVALEQDANHVRQGIALICLTPKVIAGFRQGFYPERPDGLPPAVNSAEAAPGSPAVQAEPRYEPGTADLCEVEVYSMLGEKPVQADFVIYSFSGYWDRFKEFLRELKAPPVVEVRP